MKDEKIVEPFMSVLTERKALDPEAIPLENSFTDFIVVATASSRRHAQGLADAILEFCHETGRVVLGVEGYDLADWILIDCNEAVINIFQQETRDLYRLEDLWSRVARSANKETWE